MKMFVDFISDINSIISSDVFVVFILLCSVYFTIVLFFPQFRFIKKSFTIILQNNKTNKVGISQVKAFLTTLGSRLGVGNIIGVASAISIGGPGSIFWM